MTNPTNNLAEAGTGTKQVFEHAYTALLSRQRAARNGTGTTAWLKPVRDRAIRTFVDAGFPTPRDEDWKYTSLASVAERSAAYLGRDITATDIKIVRPLLAGLPLNRNAYTIVFANGFFREDLSTLPTSDAELRIETLARADEQVRRKIQSRLSQSAQIERSQLAALNTAFLTDGLVIRIKDDTKVSRPIHTVFVCDGQQTSVQPRVLIDLGKCSEAMLTEHYIGEGAGLTNAVTEIRCADGAHLKYIKVQEESHETYHLAAQYVSLEKDSRFDAVHIDLGGKLTRNDLTVRLEGSGSTTNLHGLFLVDGKRHADNHTRIDHLAYATTSQESYRGILNDRGRGIFNGKIIVHSGADQTDAQLNNRNLLLAATAEVDTKPELEIYTDDVKCSHGSTTGQLDADAMFYLQTRGVPKDVARRLLVGAFAREIIDRIDVDAAELAQHIGTVLESRLPG
jgi:Fe-S cluster assembly protein SufD